MLSAAIALVATAAVLAAAQDQPPPQPTFRTEANYVRVDVYPTSTARRSPTCARKTSKSSRTGPQKVEQFERIADPQRSGPEGRREPNTVASRGGPFRTPRARVFVLFLDIKHVEGDASRNIAQTARRTRSTD